MHLSVFIFSIALLITLISLLKPLAEKINFPYTVMLAVVGILLGLVIMYGGQSQASLAGEMLHSIDSVTLTSKAIIFIFLPALIFESALSIEVSNLMKNIRPILILAILGLLISTFIIGYSLTIDSTFGLAVCLLIGAIASATDPVAVVAIFKSIGAPAKLNVLVEGESLFNDGTAIVLFTIISGVLINNSSAISIWSGIGFFLKTFIGGLVIGFIIGYLFIWIMSKLIKQHTVIMTLLVTLPYLTFVLAEHFCHVSGVLAVIANALVINSYGRSSILPTTLHDVHALWEEIAFWANSLIFVFMNLLMPSLLANVTSTMMWSIVILIVSAFVARAIITYLLLPLMTKIKLCEPISRSYRTVMFWGALRGSVSLALVLSLLENPQIDKNVSEYITVVTAVFVLFTLFINATTIQGLLNWLGIKNLSQANQQLRANRWDFINRRTLHDIQEKSVLELYSPEVTGTIQHDYVQRIHEHEHHHDISLQAAEEVILLSLIYQERLYYDHLFDDGYIDSQMVEFFRIHLNNCKEQTITSGVTGFKKALEELFQPTLFFLIALYMQRFLSVSHYLKHTLTKRFKCAFIFRSATQHLQHKNRDEYLSLGNEQHINQFLNYVFEIRHHVSTKIHRSLGLQYPDFTKRLESKFYKIFIHRTELKHLKELNNNGIINPLVYASMLHDVQDEIQHHEHMPELDLGLDPLEMLQKVELFSSLSESQLKLLAAHVKSEMMIPGEFVCKQGTRSDSMYFISSGVLKVCVPEQPVYLANGDFFGEIALLTGQPRTADVISETYSTLLVLKKHQFVKALEAYPEIIKQITSVAEQRLRTGSE